MARASKDVLVICLDVGLGMQHHAPGEVSALDRSCSIAAMLIQRKIFADSKDQVALVLFGCEETANQLAEEHDTSYNNISIAFHPGVATFDLLNHVTGNVKPGNTTTDFLDALTVCLDLLHTETRGDQKVNCRRIVLFTNFNHCCSDDSINGIISGFSTDGMQVELSIIGPTIQMDDAMKTEDSSSGDEAGPSTSKRMRLDCKAPDENMIDENTRKPKSAEQVAGENAIRSMYREGVAGMCYSFSDAMKAVTGFEKRSVRPAAWKCKLQLGRDLSIPCVAYAKTKEAHMKQTWKKCHAKTHKADDIMTNQYFHADDEDLTEVPRQDVGKGYRYGKDIIPFSAEDERQLKYQTDEKCLTILGFTDVNNVPPYLHTGDQAQYVIPEKGDSASGVGLFALVVAMQQQGLCAVACHVFRRGTNPKLVALIPRSRHDYKCLVMVALPFSEDLRPLCFPTMAKSLEPSQQQLDCIDQLIDSMDLTDKSNDEELYDPKEMLNPFFQYTFQCLHRRSTHPHGDANGLEASSYNPLSPNTAIMERSQVALANTTNLFKLQKCDPQNHHAVTKRWKDFSAKDETSTGDDLTRDSYEPLATITSATVKDVGTISPREDFIAILSNNQDDGQTVVRAFEQLQKRIDDFVDDPFAMKLSDKILASLQIMMSHAEQHHQTNGVNRFLIRMRANLVRSNPQLWKLLIENSINIIGDDDYEGTNRSNFYLENNESSDPLPERDEAQEEAEDLLDMID